MKLTVRNFAGIKNEEIIFDGITLIAGLNDTGKSTIGKIMDAIFKSLSNLEEKREKERIHAILDVLRRTSELSFAWAFGKLQATAEAINQLEEANEDKIKEIIMSYIYQNIKLEKNPLDAIDINKIIEIKKIENQALNLKIISKVFQKIFNNQINNVTNNSIAEVILTVKNCDTKLTFENDTCTFYESNTNIVHSTIYINDPFKIDEMNHFYKGDDLLVNLCKEEENIVESILGTSKLETVFQLFDLAAQYEIVNSNQEYYAKRKETSGLIKIPNLSTGIKSFLIIRRLIENGSLKEKDVLILDEPEIHLHPEWQLIYAELIVLIQKVFDLTVFITSHSPYFIEAIEIFTKKHNTQTTTNFYLTNKENKDITIDKVETTEKIFQLLASPFQHLEEVEEELRSKNGKSISE